ncbi:MAG: ATP12 family chaperone protein [Mangrovicoccus sp.]
MSEWKAKRFWTEVQTVETDTGYAIHLDGRPVRSPAKTLVNVPSLGLAEMIADEWRSQGELIDPNSMPAMRIANSALDKVTPQFTEVADMLAAYGESDLLCYRADGPAELVDRQAAAWDPVLAWAAEKYNAPLSTGQGVMFIAQPEQSLQALAAQVHALSPFQLAPFHDLVALTGSLVLALAASQAYAEASEIWNLSRIDEDWQIEQWGEDEEATALAERKKAEFQLAYRVYHLI